MNFSDDYPEQVKDFQKYFNESVATDTVEVDHKSAEDLRALWLKSLSKHNDNITGIPSDLFFNHTLPILDINIIRVKFSARVKIIENYKHITDTAEEWTFVGLMRIEAFNTYGFYPIGVKKGENEVNVYGSHQLVDTSTLQVLSCSNDLSHISEKVANDFIDVWYGIQLALLHPVVKTIFEKPKMEKIPYKNRSKAQHGKSVIKYVKKHYIKPDELENLIYGNNNGKSYHRHALIWHVIGHWREYKNGHKVFIQPYWKGALKDSAEKTTVTRKIIINEQET